MTGVVVNTYMHSVTYVADNILKSMKDIIRLSGLDPKNLVDGWSSNMRALQVWLDSRHLEKVVLEIFDPRTDALVGRWDIDVIYTTGSGDGGSGPTQSRSNTTSVRQGWRPAKPSIACCCRTSGAIPMSMDGDQGNIDRRRASCGTALARQSSTMACAAVQPIGGNT